MVELDFTRCRSVWVLDQSEAGGFWNPPFEHVKTAVKWIIDHPYGLLADEMGLSKTASALIAVQFLHDMDLIDRVIIIAPAAVRPKVWFDQDLGQIYEQAFDDKRLTVTEFHSRIKKWTRGPESAKELRIICSNYEFIRSEKNLNILLPYCGPRTFLILDESSAVRGWKSAQTEACMKLRWQTNKKGNVILGVPRCGRILEMNGTPVAETPLDLFSQGNLLHPSILDCRYITLYKARYAVQEPVMKHNGQPLLDKWNRPVLTIKAGEAGWTNIPDLQKRFAPYILRREAKDFGIDFALPPVGLDVTLTPETWRIYCEMKKELVVWLKSGVATAAQAGVKAIRLAQITSGFLGGIEDSGIEDEQFEFDGLSLPVVAEIRPKPEAVQEIGREKLDFALTWHADLLARYPDLKLLTWCRFVPELRRYLAEVKKFGHPVGAACGAAVLGGKQKDERETALRLLHPKTAPIGPATVGATQGTGAVGLNFTACRTVLDMSYDASAWKKRQGDARVNRTGQTGPVSFFYLVAVGPRGQKTMDHHLMMLRLGKMNVNDLTVAAWVSMLEEE